MSIWFYKDVDIAEELNKRSANTMMEFLDIKMTEFGDDYLKARMPITRKVKQPLGIMHGGASCVLAESVGSSAANACVDITKSYCVGLDINTNHIRSISEGCAIATATAFHLGRSTQVWSINIHDESNQKLISVNRLTMAVLTR